MFGVHLFAQLEMFGRIDSVLLVDHDHGVEFVKIGLQEFIFCDLETVVLDDVKSFRRVLGQHQVRGIEEDEGGVGGKFFLVLVTTLELVKGAIAR